MRDVRPSDEAFGQPPATDVARVAGRGGLAVAFAKIYFIVTGLVQQIALPRLVGLDGYGALGTALSITSVTYNPVVGTSIQGVSRAVAQNPGNEASALRRTFALHVALSTLLAVAFFVLAPELAAVIGAPHVAGTLRILSAVIFVYGMYTPLVGALNGMRRFVHQAGLDIAAATLRTVGLIGGAYALSTVQADRFAGVEGAAWGFVAGAVVVFAAALVIVGVGRRGPGGPSLPRHLTFIAHLFVGQVLLNFLLQADLTLLRAFAAEAATQAGLTPRAADAYVGAYRATQLFSFLPYQLLIAVTFVLFPMLASAKAAPGVTSVKDYVATGLRLALVIAGAMVSVTSGLAEPLLRLVFGAEAADHGARALELLAVGFGAFAIFGILTTILNSLGRERESTLVTLAASALVVLGCFVWVRDTPLSDELLFRTASATSVGIVLATVGASFLVRRAAGGLVPFRVVARVAAATLVATMFGRFVAHAPLALVPLVALVVAGVYAGVLVVTRELGATDLALVRRVLKRSA